MSVKQRCQDKIEKIVYGLFVADRENCESREITAKFYSSTSEIICCQ